MYTHLHFEEEIGEGLFKSHWLEYQDNQGKKAFWNTHSSLNNFLSVMKYELYLYELEFKNYCIN